MLRWRCKQSEGKLANDFIVTYFVITLVGTTELSNKTNENQLADLGKFGVDDRDEGGKDRCEREGRRLSPHNGSSKETLSADKVLSKEFRNDVLDVGDVDLKV
jgi:hypothetical protein